MPVNTDDTNELPQLWQRSTRCLRHSGSTSDGVAQDNNRTAVRIRFGSYVATMAPVVRASYRECACSKLAVVAGPARFTCGGAAGAAVQAAEPDRHGRSADVQCRVRGRPPELLDPAHAYPTCGALEQGVGRDQPDDAEVMAHLGRSDQELRRQIGAATTTPLASSRLSAGNTRGNSLGQSNRAAPSGRPRFRATGQGTADQIERNRWHTDLRPSSMSPAVGARTARRRSCGNG
jgi:hypothetical protein